MPATSPKIPERLAHLPVCLRRRLPVPYANALTPDGQADFATLDSQKVLTIARDRLCGVCGRPLGYWIVFIGGPRCAQNRAFLDPPMHDDCARAALRLCPYLAREQMQRRKTTDLQAITPPGFVEDKPHTYLMYLTRSYTTVVTPDGVIFRPAPALRIARLTYVQGRLHPET